MAKIQLQKPEFAYMRGQLIPWDNAVLHIGCEAVTRGLNVFEGIKGYWQKNDRFGIIFLEKHYKRLLRSAKLLQIPCSWSYSAFEDAVFELIGALLTKEKDMWIRTTLYVIEGHWGEGTKSDLVMMAYHQDKEEPPPINIGISTWQRSPDISLPARIKTSTNYQVSRLARIEGRERDCQDMILLNTYGRVAEATGSCVLMVRDGVVYTPPPTEGALESITLDFVEQIAKSLNIKFVRRPVDRTELLIADEIAICGTLAELVKVRSIAGAPLDENGPVLKKIRDRFFSIVRGEQDDALFEVSYVPKNKMKNV